MIRLAERFKTKKEIEKALIGVLDTIAIE